MFVRVYRCPVDSDECYNVTDERISPVLVSVPGLAFALCAALNRCCDSQAYKVAAYFYPDIQRFQPKQLEAGLAQLMSGEMPPGEVDMANFIEGSPSLAGHFSMSSHVLYRLIVGLAHAPHGRVTFSPGDCADFERVFELYRPILERNGFPNGPGGAAIDEVVRAFQRANGDQDCFVEIAP